MDTGGAALFAPVCSIASTKRRRFFWAAWWTAAPTREPFRAPDAASGGARTAAEALENAERAAGRALVEVEGAWARAWSRILVGEPAWPKKHEREEVAKPSSSVPVGASAWTVLGLPKDATSDAIKRAYRARALETHPDRGGDSEAFREVHRAYERALASSKRKPRKKRRA